MYRVNYYFKLLRLLPFKVIFQSLAGKYFLFYLTWNFSYINSKIGNFTSSCSFQSNILVGQLTLLNCAHVCVILYQIYESHRERTSKLAVKDVRKHLLTSN